MHYHAQIATLKLKGEGTNDKFQVATFVFLSHFPSQDGSA
jgi:hypothetical protein